MIRSKANVIVMPCLFGILFVLRLIIVNRDDRTLNSVVVGFEELDDICFGPHESSLPHGPSRFTVDYNDLSVTHLGEDEICGEFHHCGYLPTHRRDTIVVLREHVYRHAHYDTEYFRLCDNTPYHAS